MLCSRPPHGGRGLKFEVSFCFQLILLSSSTRGTWIEMASRQANLILRLVVLHTGDVD